MAGEPQSDYEKDIIELKTILIEFLNKNPNLKPLTDEEKEELVTLLKTYLSRDSGPIAPT